MVADAPEEPGQKGEEDGREIVPRQSPYECLVTLVRQLGQHTQDRLFLQKKQQACQHDGQGEDEPEKGQKILRDPERLGAEEDGEACQDVEKDDSGDSKDRATVSGGYGQEIPRQGLPEEVDQQGADRPEHQEGSCNQEPGGLVGNEGADQAVNAKQDQGNERGDYNPHKGEKIRVKYLRNVAAQGFRGPFEPQEDLLLAEEAVKNRHEEGQHDQGAGDTEQAALFHDVSGKAWNFQGQPDGPVPQPVDRAEIKPEGRPFEEGSRLVAHLGGRLPQACFHVLCREGDGGILAAGMRWRLFRLLPRGPGRCGGRRLFLGECVVEREQADQQRDRYGKTWKSAGRPPC